MEFGFLLNTERMLLSIGFRGSAGSAGRELLRPFAPPKPGLRATWASPRAIFQPGIGFVSLMMFTPVGADTALISWSGSMFEYLMPSLGHARATMSVLRNRPTACCSVGLQSLRITTPVIGTYQARNFGVPGLGLKRGLGQSVVVAPSRQHLFTAVVDPTAAARNFERLASEGGQGQFGWFEALDYTPSRLPLGQSVAVIRPLLWRITRHDRRRSRGT